MVLLDRALDARDRNRERLREEGRAEWRAWFERREAALARGEPFAEPPPGD